MQENATYGEQTITIASQTRGAITSTDLFAKCWEILLAQNLGSAGLHNKIEQLLREVTESNPWILLLFLPDVVQ